MQQRDVSLRVAAGLAACALLPFAVAAAAPALLLAAFAAQAPDEFAVSGDPCCTPPATWGEVLLAGVAALAAASVATVLCAAVASLARTVVVERGLRRRTILRTPLYALPALLVVLPVAWIADEPRLRADCDSFTVQRGDWHGDEGDRWRSAEAIDRCGALTGRRARDVRRLFGEREERRAGGVWVYPRAADAVDASSYPPELRVVVRDGRVRSARIG